MIKFIKRIGIDKEGLKDDAIKFLIIILPLLMFYGIIKGNALLFFVFYFLFLLTILVSSKSHLREIAVKLIIISAILFYILCALSWWLRFPLIFLKMSTPLEYTHMIVLTTMAYVIATFLILQHSRDSFNISRLTTLELVHNSYGGDLLNFELYNQGEYKATNVKVIVSLVYPVPNGFKKRFIQWLKRLFRVDTMYPDCNKIIDSYNVELHNVGQIGGIKEWLIERLEISEEPDPKNNVTHYFSEKNLKFKLHFFVDYSTDTNFPAITPLREDFDIEISKKKIQYLRS